MTPAPPPPCIEFHRPHAFPRRGVHFHAANGMLGKGGAPGAKNLKCDLRAIRRISLHRICDGQEFLQGNTSLGATGRRQGNSRCRKRQGGLQHMHWSRNLASPCLHSYQTSYGPRSRCNPDGLTYLKPPNIGEIPKAAPGGLSDRAPRSIYKRAGKLHTKNIQTSLGYHAA